MGRKFLRHTISSLEGSTLKHFEFHHYIKFKMFLCLLLLLVIFNPFPSLALFPLWVKRFQVKSKLAILSHPQLKVLVCLPVRSQKSQNSLPDFQLPCTGCLLSQPVAAHWHGLWGLSLRTALSPALEHAVFTEQGGERMEKPWTRGKRNAQGRPHRGSTAGCTAPIIREACDRGSKASGLLH